MLDRLLGRSRPPIVVGGCYRSGTSLLRRMLDAHPAIHCGPEVKFLRDFHGYYLTDDLAHARFFQTARTLGVDDRELLRIFGRAFVELHELAARKRGKRRWADKNPENVRYMEDWEEVLGGRLVFVHVVRDPLDVLTSLVEARFDRAVPAAFEGKVEVCREFLEAGLAYAEAHPGRSVTVRYEELVERPETVLRELCQRIDEPFDERMIGAFNSPERQEGIEDPKVKTQDTVHAGSVGRWRRELAPDDVRLAIGRLAHVAKRAGYDLREP